MKGRIGTSMSFERKYSSDRDDGKFEVTAKFDSKCAGCGKKVHKNHRVFYMPEQKAVWHIGCEDLPKRGRVGYSSRASRAVGLNGGSGSSNRKVR